MTDPTQGQDTTLPPCTSCGACCVDWYGDGTVADLDRGDEKRLGARRLKLYTINTGGPWPDEAHRATSTRTDALGSEVCRALRGTVGRRCSCRVYDDRPKLCRAYKRGSAACLGARERAGLA